MAAYDEQEPPEWKKRGQQWSSGLEFGNRQKNQGNGM
jgi:hypothetical protein